MISSYDKTVDKPIEKRVSAESKLKRNGRNIDEIQLKLRTQKRVSDQFYVDIRDPSGAKVSVGAVTSFNFHKSSPEVELTGIQKINYLNFLIRFIFVRANYGVLNYNNKNIWSTQNFLRLQLFKNDIIRCAVGPETFNCFSTNNDCTIHYSLGLSWPVPLK